MNTPDTAAPLPSAILNSPSSPNPRRRRGKIARLPFELRNLVNQWLREGHSYDEVAFRLVPHLDCEQPEITLENIGQWCRGGYREWLEQQERFEKSHPRTLSADALLGKITPNGASQASDLCENLVVNLITQTVQDLDPEKLKNLFSTNPDAFFRLTDRLASLISHRTRRHRAELETKKFDNLVAQQELKKQQDHDYEIRRQGRAAAWIQMAEERLNKDGNK